MADQRLFLCKKALVGEISLSTWLAIQPVWNIAEMISFWLLYTVV